MYASRAAQTFANHNFLLLIVLESSLSCGWLNRYLHVGGSNLHPNSFSFNISVVSKNEKFVVCVVS